MNKTNLNHPLKRHFPTPEHSHRQPDGKIVSDLSTPVQTQLTDAEFNPKSGSKLAWQCQSKARKKNAVSQFPQLQADECLNPNGFTTIRPYDGSPNGDTDKQPIATVYDPGHAQAIVRACNNAQRLADALKDCIAALDLAHDWPSEAQQEAAKSALADWRAQ